MPVIEIYTTRFCPYCVRAKQLLNKKGAVYTEIPVDANSDKKREMIDRSKRFTVPQIFIGDYHVGGYDDMVELDLDDKLDDLLKGGDS